MFEDVPGPPAPAPLPDGMWATFAPDFSSTPQVAGHTVVGGSVVAAIMNVLPPIIGLIAAIAGAIYYCICVWESRTVQHAVNNWLMRTRARKVLRLKAKAKLVSAQLVALETVRVAKREARELVEEARVEAAADVADAEVSMIENPTHLSRVIKSTPLQ